MAKLYNLARMTSSTIGTGPITLGSAVSGCLSFSLAGVQNGDVISYGITDGINSEVGRGTYTSAGTVLARTTILKSTNANAAISLSGNAEIFVTALAEDIVFVDSAGNVSLAQNTIFGWDAGGGETAITLISNSGALQVNKEIRISALTGVTGCFGVRNVDDNSLVFACENLADSTNRFRILQDGTMCWGDGTAIPDIYLYRATGRKLVLQSVGTGYKTLEIYTNAYGAVINAGADILYMQAAAGFRMAGDYSYFSIYNGAVIGVFLSSFSLSYTVEGFGVGTSTDGMTAGGSLAIAQDLAHRGTKIGFYNHATAAQPAAYTPSNVTPDRSYNANATTLDEVADVLGTLIADLQSIGLIG